MEYAFCQVPLDEEVTVKALFDFKTEAKPLKVKLFRSGHEFDSVKSGIPSLSSSTSKISGTPSPSLSVHAWVELLIA